MKKFSAFILESEYMKYSDYEILKDNKTIPFLVDSQIMMDKAKEAIQRLFPMQGSSISYSKVIINLADLSVENKGIKFEAELINGEFLQIFKLKETKSFNDWEYYLNGKKINKKELEIYLKDLIYFNKTDSKELIEYKKLADSYDIFSQFSDDRSKFNNFHSTKNTLIFKFNNLNKKEKYSA
jgi:hypothetical protein